MLCCYAAATQTNSQTTQEKVLWEEMIPIDPNFIIPPEWLAEEEIFIKAAMRHKKWTREKVIENMPASRIFLLPRNDPDRRNTYPYCHGDWGYKLMF